MRQLVYSVATSLDGFIAGPKGEFDWIIQDPTMNFGEMFRQFGTAVMGRHTYEAILREGRSPREFGMKVFVASTTLDQAQHRDVTIIGSGVAETVRELKRGSGKDIWLFGGGSTFRNLLDAGLVDRVEVSIIPVLLGGGIPLVPEGRRWPLQFKDSRTFPSGIISLTYLVASLTATLSRTQWAEAHASAHSHFLLIVRSEVVHQADAGARIPARVCGEAGLEGNQRESRRNVIAISTKRPARVPVVVQSHAATPGERNTWFNGYAAGVHSADQSLGIAAPPFKQISANHNASEEHIHGRPSRVRCGYIPQIVAVIPLDSEVIA